MMFLYAVGAIASPYLASVLIEGFGSAAMFVMIALAHVLLVIFGLVRMRARPAPQTRTPYTDEPRTSFQIGRLLGWLRDRP
jgi:sugar phosphate permease